MIILDLDEPVGTMYTYRYSSDGHLYISIFVSDKVRRRGVGVKAFSLWCEELMNELDLFKIYVEVYDYNSAVIRLLNRFGAIQEARLKEHRKNCEVRCDLLLFALYRDTIAAGIQRLDKLGLLGQKHLNSASSATSKAAISAPSRQPITPARS
jgi:RimJ/RimL family protein N-acetyltransferase